MDNQNTPQPLPIFFVGRAIVESRVADYQQKKLPLLSEAIGKPETKSIWYTKDHIAGLLNEIENAGGDGLRLHFGTYEAGHAFAGQQCLLMTVTREETTGGVTRHKDVYLEDEPGFEQRLAKERDFSTEDEGSRDFNFGSPCPPACD